MGSQQKLLLSQGRKTSMCSWLEYRTLTLKNCTVEWQLRGDAENITPVLGDASLGQSNCQGRQIHYAIGDAVAEFGIFLNQNFHCVDQ